METPSNPKTEDYTYKQGQYSPRKRKDTTEAANSIARERNLVQSKDIGKANREEIKQAMDGILARMQGFDLAGFSRELEKLGFRVREARASTGKLNGYYVTSRSGTEYKASEIGKGYTLAHLEKTQKKLKYNSISRNYGNILKPKDGGLHL
ncbi:relaxase/mobilization nuclease domain-containing protein [Bacteroides thetaiotaomicron]|nr:relaxase/mobilization nuclease domain-containing protein [Bacteroides thetaiotaomicron]